MSKFQIIYVQGCCRTLTDLIYSRTCDCMPSITPIACHLHTAGRAHVLGYKNQPLSDLAHVHYVNM